MAVDTIYAPYTERDQDLAQAGEAVDSLVKGGARNVQISLHGVTFDQLDKTWQLALVPGSAPSYSAFVTARKKFGAVEVVCIAVERSVADES